MSRGRLVSFDNLPGLPRDYTAQKPSTDARFVFLAGEKNQCFLPESQRRTHEFFSRIRPDFHALHVLPRYSHLDVFMGRTAHRDVFPLILRELAAPVRA